LHFWIHFESSILYFLFWRLCVCDVLLLSFYILFIFSYHSFFFLHSGDEHWSHVINRAFIRRFPRS
jgi:hypothetical protein